MKNTIFIVDLESVPTRYTCQWQEGLPAALGKYIADNGLNYDVINISGEETEQITTPGAFLNFAGTNAYKAQQAIAISQMVADGRVRDGDRFLFTDAWNPVIIQVKYMMELLGINAKLHGIWHAGSYDPQDFLGRLVKDKRWSLNTERAIFHALDKNIFATEFHKKLFVNNVLLSTELYGGDIDADIESKIYISGQPHESMVEELSKFRGRKKRDLILFPHRIAPEKQPEIFKDLQASLPEYQFIMCQEQQLTKDQYHEMMAEAKIVFSANLQETLGISAMEAFVVDTIALVPDRLSYVEMYDETFKYASEWTIDWDAYVKHKNQLIQSIKELMNFFDAYHVDIETQRERLLADYMNADAMYRELTQ